MDAIAGGSALGIYLHRCRLTSVRALGGPNSGQDDPASKRLPSRSRLLRAAVNLAKGARSSIEMQSAGHASICCVSAEMQVGLLQPI